MRKFLQTFAVVVLLVCACAAQRKDDVALKNTGTGLVVIPSAPIRVCINSATGTPCSTLASVCPDATLTGCSTGLATFTADVNGNYHFFASPSNYQVQITDPATGTTITQTDVNIPPSTAAPNAWAANQTAPNWVAKDILQSQNSTIEAFGDSFTVGFGLTTPSTQNWAAQYAAAKSLTLTNHAISGSMCSDQADFFLAATPGTSSEYLWMLGYNDMRVHGTNATQLLEAKACILAGVSWLAIPNSQVVTAQSAGCVASGTWVTLAAYGGAIGKSGTSNTSNMTCTTPPGTTVILYTLTQANNNATFSVSIDGAALQVNQSPAGSGTTFSELGTTTTYLNSRTYAPAAYRFVGLPNQPHSVSITGISANGTTDNIQILGVAAVSSSTSTNLGPAVVVSTIPRDNATGYAVTCSPVNCNNGSDAAVGIYSMATAEVVAGLVQDGLRVTLFDVTSGRVFDPAVAAGLIQVDNIHPNLAGHTSITNSALAATNNINNRRFPHLFDRPVLRGGLCGLNSTACQQQRVATCSTTTTQFNACTTVVTWPTPFLDTNYTFTCSLDNPNQAGMIGWANNKVAASITAVTVNLGSGTAVTTGTVNCVAVHQQ